MGKKVDIEIRRPLKPQSRLVSVEGKRLVVTEPSAVPGLEYQDGCARAYEMQKAGKFHEIVFRRLELNLLAECVYDVQDDGETPHRDPVGLVRVSEWAYEVVDELADVVKSIGRVDRELAAKND